jgi:hypothetical protein
LRGDRLGISSDDDDRLPPSRLRFFLALAAARAAASRFISSSSSSSDESEEGRCGPDAVTLRGRGDLLGVAFLADCDPSDETGEGAIISVGAHECSGDTNAYFREWGAGPAPRTKTPSTWRHLFLSLP